MTNKTCLYPIRTSDYSNSIQQYIIMLCIDILSPFQQNYFLFNTKITTIPHSTVPKILKLPSTGDKEIGEKSLCQIRVPHRLS